MDPDIKWYTGFDTSGLSGGLVVCRPVELPEYLDYLIEDGKAVLKVLEWVKKLIP